MALDYPLVQIHKLAFKAAEAVRCANDQGQFWEMHARLFANHSNLEPWNGHAEALGLDIAAFEACLASEKHAPAIRRDMALATKAGTTGTPSFVLAETDADDLSKVKGITFIRGAQPYATFKSAIDSALSESE